MNELRTSQLAAMWGLAERQTRNILSELETLGFELAVDDYGARRLNEEVAAAVASYRKQGRLLAQLVNEPDLRRYLRRDTDPLAELIDLRTEMAILRESFGEVWKGIQLDAHPMSYRDIGWRMLGLPDPRRGL